MRCLLATLLPANRRHTASAALAEAEYKQELEETFLAVLKSE